MEITRKEKRATEREGANQTSKMKSYKDYDWLGMAMEETLRSLKDNANIWIITHSFFIRTSKFRLRLAALKFLPIFRLKCS